MHGSFSWMLCAPQGVKGFDDDDWGIKDIFILVEFLVRDVSGQPTSHIFNGPAKLSQNISNYQKMVCNIPEEQRFQLQNLSWAV